MNGIITSLLVLLATPVPAEPLHSTSAPVGCTGDYVCGDDPSVVATWPLERWETVRRVRQLTLARSAVQAKLPAATKH